MAINPDDPPWKRILDGMALMIQGLTLAGVDGSPGAILPGQVFVQTQAASPNNSYPCVLVIWSGQRELVEEIAFELNSYQYPVRVLILDRSDVNYLPTIPKYLAWRKQLLDLFNRELIVGVAEVYDTQLQPEVAADPTLPAEQFYQSAFMVRALTYESRS